MTYQQVTRGTYPTLLSELVCPSCKGRYKIGWYRLVTWHLRGLFLATRVHRPPIRVQLGHPRKISTCLTITSGFTRGDGPSLHWAIGREIATKYYQIDVSGVAILHVLCHGTGVASHREVRVTIGLDLLCSGLIMPFYIT